MIRGRSPQLPAAPPLCQRLYTLEPFQGQGFTKKCKNPSEFRKGYSFIPSFVAS